MTRQDLGIIIEDLKSKMGADDKPHTWTFGDLKRDPETGYFDDDELVKILQEATDEVAGSFGARGEWIVEFPVPAPTLDSGRDLKGREMRLPTSQS